MSYTYEKHIEKLEKEILDLKRQSLKNAGRAIDEIIARYDLKNGDTVGVNGIPYKVIKNRGKHPVLKRIYRRVEDGNK